MAPLQEDVEDAEDRSVEAHPQPKAAISRPDYNKCDQVLSVENNSSNILKN